MKKPLCCFALLLFSSGFSQSSFSHIDILKNRLSGKEQAQKKQATLVSLKDSTYYSNWDANALQWENPSRILYSYNAADKETSFTDATLSGGVWRTNNKKVNYSFDVDYNLLGYELQKWGPGWVNSQKYTYTYDNANNRLTELQQIWVASTNSWRNNAYTINTYDANHNLLTCIKQNWDMSTSSWANTIKETATYNTNNEYTSDIIEMWSTVTSSWENFKRSMFVYANGDITGLVEELYDSGTSTYYASCKGTYSYDSNHNLLSGITQRPFASIMAWANAERYTYTYDSYDNQITYLSERWNLSTAVWENEFQQSDYYSYKTVGLNTATGPAEQISLYPNPASDNIKLLNESGIAFTSLSIMDVNGKQVLTQTIENATTANIPLHTLSQGIYMLELKRESGTVYKKFVKN